jgi:hypothetical protein
MKTIRKVFGTRPSSWVQVPRAYYYLALAGWRLFVRRDSVQPWVKMGPATANVAPVVLDSHEEALTASAARWTNAAARRPWPWARCLQRSLALCLWLESKGLTPAIGIGVRKDGAGIEAHAWVEYKGRILNDSEVITGRFPKLVATACESVSAQ